METRKRTEPTEIAVDSHREGGGRSAGIEVASREMQRKYAGYYQLAHASVAATGAHGMHHHLSAPPPPPPPPPGHHHWVRYIDQSTGRPYWHHTGTNETRWE